ncbi:MAG: hypothetical protein U0V74_12770 [Chitinophagales bacterium]
MKRPWLFKICFTAVLILLLAFAAWHIAGLEFANLTAEEITIGIYFFGIPFCIIGVVISSIKRGDPTASIVIKLMGGAALTLVYLFAFTMFLFADMCSYSTRQILYINKSNNERQIVVRDFGCGATDSSPASIHIQEVQTIAGLFMKVREADTTALNKSEWIPFQ